MRLKRISTGKGFSCKRRWSSSVTPAAAMTRSIFSLSSSRLIARPRKPVHAAIEEAICCSISSRLKSVRKRSHRRNNSLTSLACRSVSLGRVNSARADCKELEIPFTGTFCSRPYEGFSLVGRKRTRSGIYLVCGFRSDMNYSLAL